ncbi:MAG TPA: effector-associated domain EAD1-containing protein [Trebonia sp.]|nr:effector-associated domain EAD1-containing protein [Trebonia sp.]
MQYEAEKALCEAVLRAFDAHALEMLLYHDCGKQLNQIVAASDDFEFIVYRVVRRAVMEEWVVRLVQSAITRRPNNERLRLWHETYGALVADMIHEAVVVTEATTVTVVSENRAVSVTPVPESPVPEVRLMASEHFDLMETKKIIRRALDQPSSPVVGLGIRYPEQVFARKLLKWLSFYLEGLQPKRQLTLMPLMAPVSYWIGKLEEFRPDLDSVDVLCEISVHGVAPETIEEFWRGTRAGFSDASHRLILVFTGNFDTRFPDDLIPLPMPEFTRADVEDWTEGFVSQRGWPAGVARGWTEWLCERAPLTGDLLHVGGLYQHLDDSIRDLRREPDKFRARHENRQHENRM